MRCFGTIASICGDNLGSNALGGFKEGSTAKRGCRHCNATPTDFRQKVCVVVTTYHLQHSLCCLSLLYVFSTVPRVSIRVEV